MESTYISKSLHFKTSPIADDNAFIISGKYRVTVLREQLFRVEFDSNKQFEDRPTQVFWFRNITGDYSHKADKNIDIIETSKWIISINHTLPIQTGLILQSKTTNQTFTMESINKGNLLGTYRTLDQADGKVELENGLLSTEGITVFDDAQSLTFENHMISSINKNEYDLYFFGYEKDYTQCIKDYYLISGKTPLIPKYVFGNWWSRYWNYTDTELQQVIENFQERDIPLSVCIIDMDWHITDVPQELRGGWTGYTWNTDYFKDPTGFMTWLKTQGLKVSLNLHPADGIRPYDDCYKDVCNRMGINPSSEQIIDFDLTDPVFTEAYFKDVHHPLEKQGVDFWWIDWQQGTTSKMKNLDPLFALNHYHFYDGLNRGKSHYFIFSRWSGLGGHRYPIGFSGDTQITWDSLAYQPYFTSTATNVGFGWWSHDIGGHFHGKETEDLYTRWVQYGVFSPVLRLHSTKSFYHKREPWRWNPEVEYITTTYLRFRHQLIPYIHTFNHLHSYGELPLITPLYYQYPNQKLAYNYPNQYFFGTELMVSPFTSKRDKKLNKAMQKVWFHEPGWFNFFTGEYISQAGEFTLYGSLQDTNLFAKSGAIIPLATNHKEALMDLPTELDVHIFPGNNNQFTFIEDQGKQTIPSIFTLNSTSHSISLHIASQTTESHKRIIHLKFRSITPTFTIECSSDYQSTKDKQTNTHIITVLWDMITPISITLTSSQTIIENPYDFAKDVMNTIDQSHYSTETKNIIGYINYHDQKDNRGWLGKHNSLSEKQKELPDLDIPKTVKQYLLHTLERLI